MTSIREVPMHPGYALGSIIREPDLWLPIYERKRAYLEDQIEQLIVDKEMEEKSEKFKNTDNDAKQSIISNFSVKILKFKADLKLVTKKIEELIGQASLFPIEESFPLDEGVVEVKTKARAFKCERMQHMVFENKDHVLSRVEKFVTRLFLEDAPTSMLPAGALAALSADIESALGTKNTKVALIGSIICLERVKMLDPLVLRQNSCLSEETVKKAKEYYVLTGAVLGAVFLGIGKDLSLTGEPVKDSEKKWMSSLTTVSFISQGAIPKVDAKLADVNLWSVYVDWKESLKEETSGYPISFSVRRLDNVLEENKARLKKP